MKTGLKKQIDILTLKGFRCHREIQPFKENKLAEEVKFFENSSLE